MLSAAFATPAPPQTPPVHTPAVGTNGPTLPSLPRVLHAGFAPHCVPYDTGLELQRTAVADLERHATPGTLILLEHLPVYTAGRRADPAEYPTDGTPVVPVDRGGKVTWHGPGQLVAYPIVRLRKHLAVVDFVRSVERTVISLLSEYGVEAGTVPGRAGVWTQTGGSPSAPAKIAQIGIHTRAGIVTHGLAINCSNDLTPFSNFIPCGITDAGVTTISEVLGTPVTPADLAPRLTAALLPMLQELTA